MSTVNKDLDLTNLDSVKLQLNEQGVSYIISDDEDESTEEYVHFYFIGMYEGRETLYDAVIYTLRLHHNSELYEIAEHKAAQRFPEFKKIQYEEDENGDLVMLDDQEEEIGLFMAEIILELEDEGAIKVKEHVDLDTKLDYGVGLDIGLNIDVITPETIEKFITEFNEDTLKLDNTMYSFQTANEELQ